MELLVVDKADVVVEGGGLRGKLLGHNFEVFKNFLGLTVRDYNGFEEARLTINHGKNVSAIVFARTNKVNFYVANPFSLVNNFGTFVDPNAVWNE